jgi:hypothetical protein
VATEVKAEEWQPRTRSPVAVSEAAHRNSSLPLVGHAATIALASRPVLEKRDGR